jgi:hypothetical protein
VAVTAAVFSSRDAGVLGGVPLPPLPNAVRLSPGGPGPDVVVTGAGVLVLQHLLNYFYPGARTARRAAIRARCPLQPPDSAHAWRWRSTKPGLATVLATVIRRRIQPGLERLQNATLRDVRVEDLTLGAPTHSHTHVRRRALLCSVRSSLAHSLVILCARAHLAARTRPPSQATRRRW